MANLKYIRGLSGRGFRVKNNTGAWVTVKENAGSNTQVDLEDVETQTILSRERDNFVRVAGSSSTTAVLKPLTRRGIRLAPRSGTVAITEANPGVVTFTAHGLKVGDAVVFSTTDTLPTNIVAGTTYYVSTTTPTVNTFKISTTLANALAGTNVNTTGSVEAGVHTCAPVVKNVDQDSDVTVDLNDGRIKKFLKRNFGRYMVVDTAGDTTQDLVGLQDAQASFRVSDPTFTYASAGANNDLTFTPKVSGGDVITIAFPDPGPSNGAIAVNVTSTDISIDLETDADVQAEVTIDPTGTNNNVTYTAIPVGDLGNDITVEYVVPVDDDQAHPLSASVVTDVTGRHIILSLEVDTDGSTILTTADDIEAAIGTPTGGFVAVAALVTAVAEATGTSAVTVISETALSSGTPGYTHVSVSTAAEVKTAVEADSPGADDLVAVAYEGSGAGTVDGWLEAPTSLGQDPENLSRGELVSTVDLTLPFNLGQLRRRYKAWVEG